MKQLSKWFDKKKLNIKFTMIIGIIVFIPMFTFSVVLFRVLEKNEMKQAVNNAEYLMNATYHEIQKTVDLCNMTAQVFLGNTDLNQFVLRLAKHEKMETKEYVQFSRENIVHLEDMIHSNPYLYQTRIYVDNNEFPEMMPILYQKSRMQNLDFADNYTSGEWVFNYADTIFDGMEANEAKHLMALITEMTDYEIGTIAVLEIAVKMDNLLPRIFHADHKSFECFIDKDDVIYSGGKTADVCKWEVYKEELVQIARSGTEECFSTTFRNEKVVVAYKEVKELNGYLVRLESVQDRMNEIARQRNILLSVLLMLFILIVFITNGIVKAILKQFYKILKAIRQVQKGNLDVVVEEYSSDEMGELSHQINEMLSKIRNLIDENVNREVLVKNTEIRALQNQINSHFIYNVLESIKMMAEIDEKYEISDAVTSLGKLLRYSMRWTSNHVTVAEEIEYIKNYLDLMNLRYYYTINLALNIPDELYKQEIPKMSLQPVIENAIYHGIEELAQDTSIYIKAYVNGGVVAIEITDSGTGMSQEAIGKLEAKLAGEIDVLGGSGNGIGLKNVQDRIQMAFGKEYGIHILSKIDCYTKVIVTIPFQEKELV